MPPYLPVRALNRSQGLRFGKVGTTKPSATTTTYVDLGDGEQRRDLAHHATLGAIFPVGPLTNSNANVVVTTGAGFTAGNALNNSTVAAGELKDRTTALYTAIVANSGVTFTANASGNPRIDLVVVDNVTGVVSVVAGTAAATPVAPSAGATQTPLYQVAIANGASVPGAVTDVRPRP